MFAGLWTNWCWKNTYHERWGRVQRNIPRVFDSIFTFALSAEASVEFSICCSYVEIYNEKIRDLLDVEKSNLSIRKSTIAGRTDIVGSTQVYVTSPDEMNEVMERGNSNRKVAATGMNSGSSRSHSLFFD